MGKKNGKGKNPASLPVVHPKAAGIDLGSEEHYVCVGNVTLPICVEPEPVRKFGCMTPDLIEMAEWLRSCGITTAAVESTGVYWIPVASVLEDMGIEVYLVDAREAKNVPGRKTDVLDCQWIQRLHQHGLLRQAFRPSPEIEPLRSLWRHRRELAVECAKQIHLIQKSLEQMNLQLHKVITDVSGCTGMAILRTILDGERDPNVLVKFRHPQCKSSKEDFIKALTGKYKEEQIFIMHQAVDAYDFHQGRMMKCDLRIGEYIKTLPVKPKTDTTTNLPPEKVTSRRKNEPYVGGLRQQMIDIMGADLTIIEGIDTPTAFTIMSEFGYDLSKFPTEKHFASYLGLCPNNIITGGKVKRRGTRKVSSRAATALRLAAQSLWKSKSALGAFYRMMRTRLGAPKAITAAAHRLAKLIYRMLKHGENYVHQGMADFEAKRKEQALRSLKKKAKEQGYILVSATPIQQPVQQPA